MERSLTVQRVEKEHSRETIKDAEALVNMIFSFETVLTAHLLHPSLYLQSEKIDILTAIRLVEQWRRVYVCFACRASVKICRKLQHFYR